MISFVKHTAMLLAALIATTALAEKSGDGKPSTPDPQGSTAKKPKKPKAPKTADNPKTATTDSPDEPRKIQVPVEKGHPAFVMTIPYYDSNGKHEMEFKIGVAARLDDNHVEMTDLQVETFNEAGEHEMYIDLPKATLDTDTSVLTSRQHVTINRSDFELTGETLIFNTRTKQGGLGGNVHMTIYNLKEETGEEDKPAEEQETGKKAKSTIEPDTFKTPHSKGAESTPRSQDQPDKFLTSGTK